MRARSAFEAVPNISEGKDAAKVSRITQAVRAVSHVRILGLHSDPDHNRSVLTFAGEEDPVLEGAIALAKACAAELDLASQSGEHPRMGVLDVLPFVPLEGATTDDAVRLANRAGESLVPWISGLPLRFCRHYPAPQIPPRHQSGAVTRASHPASMIHLWKPDYGPRTLDPTEGSCRRRPSFFGRFQRVPGYRRRRGSTNGGQTEGERRRPSGRKGARLRCRRRAQVSMNLTDLEQTTIPVALEAVRSAAADLGASVESTELVGLAPLEAVLQTARYYLGLRELDAHHVLESRLYGPSDSRSS